MVTGLKWLQKLGAFLFRGYGAKQKKICKSTFVHSIAREKIREKNVRIYSFFGGGDNCLKGPPSHTFCINILVRVELGCTLAFTVLANLEVG